MKLTEIAIDGYKGTQNTKLHSLGSGLNVIFGSSSATRQSIASFVQDILFGPDRHALPTTAWPNGHLNVQSGGQHYRLSRPQTGHIGDLAISDLRGTGHAHRTPDLLDKLDESTYSAFFQVQLGNAGWNWCKFVDQLVSQFGLTADRADGNIPFAADRESHQTWKRSAEARTERFDSIRREMEALGNERARLCNEQNRHSQDYGRRLSEIDTELKDLHSDTSLFQRRCTPDKTNWVNWILKSPN